MRRYVPILLILVPLLYGALYLWSNWDPYGRLDKVPVAVVNSDTGIPVCLDTTSAMSMTVTSGVGD